jgi:hypothetical protein
MVFGGSTLAGVELLQSRDSKKNGFEIDGLLTATSNE